MQAIVATKQANITETIVQVVAKAVIAKVQAMAMAIAENNQRALNVGPKLGRPIMRWLTFNLRSTNKYAELLNGVNKYV